MKQLLILPGDGIGPEIMAQAVKVLTVARDKFNLPLHWDEGLVGGAAIDCCRHSVTRADPSPGPRRRCDPAWCCGWSQVGEPAYGPAPRKGAVGVTQ